MLLLPLLLLLLLLLLRLERRGRRLKDDVQVVHRQIGGGGSSGAGVLKHTDRFNKAALWLIDRPGVSTPPRSGVGWGLACTRFG